MGSLNGKKKHLVPTDLLKEKLPSDLLSNVPQAIDFIGDIAIVEIPKELTYYKKDVGKAILNANKQTSTVFAKSGGIKGVFRTRDLELIAGDNKTKTIYKEYGCIYHVDVAKAYFSPRLSNEHNRVASQVRNGETVIDLFAGVGPFSIPIAKKQKKILIYAIDINPDAILLLKRNIRLNHTENKIIAMLGDSRQIVPKKLLEKADRVIMNLPEKSVDFIETACKAIKITGGILHYYCFVKDSKPLEKAKIQLKEAVNQNNRHLKDFIGAKTVREVAPYTWQVVVDARIQ